MTKEERIKEIERLIRRVCDDEFGEKEHVYEDQKLILRRASQMNNYIPPQIREMRDLARKFSFGQQNEARLFYEQARMMADYTDDVAFGNVPLQYFPTYQSLNDNRLRGYFSWRTQWRKGENPPISDTYVMLLAQELIHNIGVADAEAGFSALQKLYTSIPDDATAYARNLLRDWLKDYIIYYRLPPEYLAAYDRKNDSERIVQLLAYEKTTDDALFEALRELASYRVERSRFVRENEEAYRRVVTHVFRAYSDFYAKNRKRSYGERLFGKMSVVPHMMFNGGAFCFRQQKTRLQYDISPGYRYFTRNGFWYCESYFPQNTAHTELGTLLRAIDGRMRVTYRYKSLLKPDNLPMTLDNLIEQEISAVLAEKKQAALPKIEIDLSALQAIRDAALQTQEKLIVNAEDAPLEEAPSAVEPIIPPPTTVQAEPPAVSAEAQASSENGLGLSPLQTTFLQALLQGESPNAIAKKENVLPSVLADEINEILFEHFGDTVIVFDGDVPELMEDYAADVRALLKG